MEQREYFEVKKDGLRQNQDGGYKVTFNFHPLEMPKDLLTDPMGTRYAMVLVKIGDSQEPIFNDGYVEGSKRKFSDLPISQQAALLIKDPVFQAWIQVSGEASANEWLKERCLIETKTQLDKEDGSAKRFKDVYADFLDFKNPRPPLEAYS